MAKHSTESLTWRLARCNHVRVLLVFESHDGAFNLAMSGCSLKSNREMTPIATRHWTGFIMRTRGRDSCSRLNQLMSSLPDSFKTKWSSGVNESKLPRA